MRPLLVAFALAAAVVSQPRFVRAADDEPLVELRGEIVDADSGKPLAARLYIQSADGTWHTAQSADDAGSAVPYRKERGASVEVHTSLSAHSFRAKLPPGKYTLTAERGKEYLTATAEVELTEVQLTDKPANVTLKLQRWSDVAALGWYSGETHVHRGLDELPTLLLAEDLNVALPLTYWVTRSGVPASRGDKSALEAGAELIRVDDTHVVYPLNTEYEIFTVDGKQHTLGAIFALNHKRPLAMGVPPVAPVARTVHEQGGLLELDKHNWPWSMMLVPVMQVDLYELANNHMWRTDFHFRRFGEAPAEYMHVEQDADGLTENGWLDFTLANYYTLLDCGFRLMPTAGTASGVHPVPLGFGRVYVQLPDGFSYDAWMQGLAAGRSFVTTGPMLTATVNGEMPGHTFEQQSTEPVRYHISGTARSATPLVRLEIVSEGQVIRSVEPANKPMQQGGYESPIDVELPIESSTWLAVRCYESSKRGRSSFSRPADDGVSDDAANERVGVSDRLRLNEHVGVSDRLRFAHTAPFFIKVPDRPLRPRREETDYLIGLIERQIARNRGILGGEALEEYHQALRRYREIAETAK
jgi:hypothetical protein